MSSWKVSESKVSAFVAKGTVTITNSGSNKLRVPGLVINMASSASGVITVSKKVGTISYPVHVETLNSATLAVITEQELGMISIGRDESLTIVSGISAIAGNVLYNIEVSM